MAGRVGKQLGIFCYLSVSIFRKITGQSWSIRVIKIARSGVEGGFSQLHTAVLCVIRWGQEQ